MGGKKMSSLTKERAAEIANTIANQMGGIRRLVLMVNAKNITYNSEDGSLSFRFMKGQNKVNFVRVLLDRASDTYEMKFVWVRGVKWSTVKCLTGVYCDQLISVFQDITGLALVL